MKKLISFFNRIMQRYLPDPFLFVVILTFIVLVLGLIFTESSVMNMVQYWGDGFWNLLAFSMQMVLVLVTGYVLASSPIFKKALGALAGKAKSPGQAIVIVTIVSIIASWVNWGFGLVIGALFAKELARQVKNVDYRLLIASAYIGFIVWHGGFSGSIPLTIATEGHFSQDLIGIIPTSETIFASFNVLIVIALFIILPILNRLMMPAADETVTVDQSVLNEGTAVKKDVVSTADTPADRLENSFIVSLLTAVLGIAFLVYYFAQNGFQLNLNIVNFLFLFLGILFHGTPRRFLEAVLDAVKGAGGIIIQFPFYAGIMGMMTASGLAAVMSEGFVHISNSPFRSSLSSVQGSSTSLFLQEVDSGLSRRRLCWMLPRH